MRPCCQKAFLQCWLRFATKIEEQAEMCLPSNSALNNLRHLFLAPAQFIPQLEGLPAVPQDPLQAFPFSFPPPPPHQAALGPLASSLVAVFLAFQIQVKGQVVGLAGALSIPKQSHMKLDRSLLHLWGTDARFYGCNFQW